MTEIYKTTETNGHFHLISNPQSGFTDTAEDGHKHSLNIPTCAACRKTRKILVGGVEKLAQAKILHTQFVMGHHHYFSAEAIPND